MTIAEIRIIEDAVIKCFDRGTDTPTIVGMIYGEANQVSYRTLIGYKKNSTEKNPEKNPHETADLIRISGKIGGIYAIELVSENASVFININGVKTVNIDGTENSYRAPNSNFNYREFITDILKNIEF